MSKGWRLKMSPNNTTYQRDFLSFSLPIPFLISFPLLHLNQTPLSFFLSLSLSWIPRTKRFLSSWTLNLLPVSQVLLIYLIFCSCTCCREVIFFLISVLIYMLYMCVAYISIRFTILVVKKTSNLDHLVLYSLSYWLSMSFLCDLEHWLPSCFTVINWWLQMVSLLLGVELLLTIWCLMFFYFQLIECPSIYELMACPDFHWQNPPRLEIWREKHDDDENSLIMLDSYTPEESITIFEKSLSSNTVSGDLTWFLF